MNQKVRYHVACCTDDNYVQACGVLLCSLFEDNPNSRFHVHILIEEISEKNKQLFLSLVTVYDVLCTFHVVDVSRLEGVRFRDKIPLTKAAYYRLLLASILDESVLKVLYLDCDMVVAGDVSPLFRLELNGYALAAVRDCKTIPLSETHRFQLDFSYEDDYFNSGLMMVNLDFWRKERVEPLLLEYAKRERIVFFHDQDALNYVFKGKWFRISPKWNRMNMVVMDFSVFQTKKDKREYVEDVRIIHYATLGDLKPWKNISLIPLRCEYLRYKALTPWKNEPLQPVKTSKAFLYGVLLSFYIDDFFTRSPLLLKIPYTIVKDTLYFIYCLLKHKPYFY